jgi:hypothetical protein
MKQTYILSHDTARQRAMYAVKTAPDGWTVTVGPPKRSGAQNAALHARLTEIAAAVPWAGSMRSVDEWKRLLTGAWCRATGQAISMLPALDGAGVEIIFRRTSELTEAECSELLSFIEAWAAENGA